MIQYVVNISVTDNALLSGRMILKAFIECKDEHNYAKFSFHTEFKTWSKLLKTVHFGHVHSLLFAPVNALLYVKALSLSFWVKIIFEQLMSFFKGSDQCIHEVNFDVLMRRKGMYMTKMNSLYFAMIVLTFYRPI